MLRFPLQRPYKRPNNPTYRNDPDGWCIETGKTDDEEINITTDRSDYIFGLSNGWIGCAPVSDYDPSHFRFAFHRYGVAVKCTNCEDGMTATEEELVPVLYLDITLQVDGEALTCGSSSERRNKLDMKTGTCETRSCFTSRDGSVVVELTVTRLVSLVHRGATAVVASARLVSGGDGKDWSVSMAASIDRDVWSTAEGSVDGNACTVTQNSDRVPSLVIETSAKAKGSAALKLMSPEQSLSTPSSSNASSVFRKRPASQVSGSDSQQALWMEGDSAPDVLDNRRQVTSVVTASSSDKELELGVVINLLDKDETVEGQQLSVEDLLVAQRSALDEQWKSVDVNAEIQDEVHCNRLQTAVRFGLFTTICNASSAAHGAPVGITKAGLTSATGSNGQVCFHQQLFHSFFLTFVAPKLALGQLRYLVGMLPVARQLAQRLSFHTGAVFPLQTISEPECGGYFLASTARMHINGDIAYVVALYLDCHPSTVDADLELQLLGLVLETADPWLHVGHWEKGDSQFQIDGVTGPDAYNALVEGDFYTNGIAKRHLLFAYDFFQKVSKTRAKEVEAKGWTGHRASKRRCNWGILHAPQFRLIALMGQ